MAVGPHLLDRLGNRLIFLQHRNIFGAKLPHARRGQQLTQKQDVILSFNSGRGFTFKIIVAALAILGKRLSLKNGEFAPARQVYGSACSIWAILR
jgi:hypothetical protein